MKRCTSEERCLAASTEVELTRLVELIDFSSDHLHLAFFFAESALSLDQARARLEETGTVHYQAAGTPEALRAHTVAQLVAPGAGVVVWFQAFGPESPAWVEAWRYASERWNERRQGLWHSPLKVLVVAAPLWAKPWIRGAAADLWSIVSLALEAHLAPPPALSLPFVPKPAPSPERQAAAVARVERALERAPWDHPLKVEGLLTAAEAAAEAEATEAVAAALASLPFEVVAAIEPPAKRERLCLRLGHLAAAAGQCELSRRALSAAGEAAEDPVKTARARRVA